MTTFCQYLVEYGKNIVKSQIENWSEFSEDENIANEWKRKLELDSEAIFIEEAQNFTSGCMYDDDCGLGSFCERDASRTTVK